MSLKFVIVTMPRSGSNMLGTMLDSHPQVACFGELMRKTPKWMLKQGYRGALRILEKLDEFKDDRVRFSRPDDFVNAAFATKPKKSIKGFKLHIDQHPPFLEQLVRDPEYKVIVLQRQNTLAQYSSGKIAEKTGQGNARKGVEIKRAQVEFNASDFRKFLKSVGKNFQVARGLLVESGRSHLEVEYTQLLDHDKLRSLLAFLGADAAAPLEVLTEKRNPSDILSRFTNSDAARKFIEYIGHSDWSKETFSCAPAELELL